MSHTFYVLTTEVAEEIGIFGSLLLFFPDWEKNTFYLPGSKFLISLDSTLNPKARKTTPQCF